MFFSFISGKRSYYWASLCSSLLYTPLIQADWHGDVKLMSDYVYRGYSKSRGNPVAQAHIDYSHSSGWFAGMDLSQVRFDDQLNQDRAELEIKPYLGWSQPISTDWRVELMTSGYIFDNKLFNERAEYAEVFGTMHYQDWLSLLVSLAPNAYQREVNVANYELNVRHDLLDNLQLSAGLGYNQAGKLLGQDYFYWNAGISWFATQHLAFDLRYVDAALKAHQHEELHHNEFYPRQQDNQYLFSATLGF